MTPVMINARANRSGNFPDNISAIHCFPLGVNTMPVVFFPVETSRTALPAVFGGGCPHTTTEISRDIFNIVEVLLRNSCSWRRSWR